MTEPRRHAAATPLTDCVRRFRRVARLAAADPLRLLPPDALADLVSLSAPIVALIDLAPFERLRALAAAPPAAPRRDGPRMRLQPVSGTRKDPRTTPAAVSSAPAPAADPGNAAVVSRQRSTEEPPRREAPLATLAERRAALRRGNIGGGADQPPLTAHFAPQADPTTGARGTPGNHAREVEIRARQHIRQQTANLPAQVTPVALGPVLVDRDETDSTPDEPFAPAPDRALREPPFTDDRRAASPSIAWLGAAPSFPALDATGSSEVPGPAVRNHRNDPGLSALAAEPSVHLAALSVPGVRPSGNEVRPAAWPRVGEAIDEPELADALFETLYRDGVDLTWP